MNNLKEKYSKEIIPKLKEKLGYKNNLATPRIDKVIINAGLSKGLKDATFIDTVESTLTRITGQRPVKTKAKKSISNFKIREGMVIGMKVTLRGKRMYDFLDKLINITLPRVRDFRGLEKESVDKNGNLTIGFREHISFPEVGSDEVERLHGLEVVINTTAKTREEGFELLKSLGFPFKD